jgi:peptide deformylase
MAIMKIALMGHPVLRRRAEEITDPTAPEVKALVSHMIETMEDAEGMGLAAPQIHVSARLVIMRTPGGDDAEEEIEDPAEDQWSGLTILVNPVIEPLGDDMTDGWEGCLSVPGLRGMVPRYKRIRYRGSDPRGGVIDRTVEGLHARVVQHECDHLDGILYPERMTDMTKLIFESEYRHLREARAEADESDEEDFDDAEEVA